MATCVVEIRNTACKCSSVSAERAEDLVHFIRLNSCSHRYELPNSDVIFSAWRCKQGYLSLGTLSRYNGCSCVFLNADSRFDDDCISMSSSCRSSGAVSTSTSNGLAKMEYDALCFLKSQKRLLNSFCSFSTSDAYLVQSGVSRDESNSKCAEFP